VLRMTTFDFLHDEVEASDSLSRFDRTSAKKPPVEWSAAKTKSRFEEQTVHLADRAGAGAGGGGGGGPSLPFRIREVKLVPRSIGSEPVFSIAKPRMLEK
ncbi:unnamed protein product, partial [Polarella glacialis]